MIKKEGKILLLVLIIFSLFVAIEPVDGAVLKGSLYDVNLNSLNNVVVEVDTIPEQRFVSKQGQYEFDLAPGNYTLTAQYIDSNQIKYVAEEKLLIVKEGTFLFDLFLFPDFSEDDKLLDYPIITEPEENNTQTIDVVPTGPSIWFLYLLGIFIFAIIIVYIYLKFLKSDQPEITIDTLDSIKKEDEMDEDLESVIEILKKNDKRMTQKELRKEIPLSEAKVSLMISELEHKGIIQKIKKGRGNIIVLKKLK
ncbi:hypothetical protein HN587_03120 [Candidatus Woesearchaeota archaeon]|jgi:uncharacterized membrane protein|nr:hypothetical protein [Candidatus Woesearchaeota archaeon]